MVSTYTTILDFEKPASGDQDGTWATTANTNYDIIEDAIAAVTSITTASGTDTLTTTQQAANEARNAVLNITSTLSGNLTLEPPDRSKPYLVRNASNQAYTVSIQPSGGTALEVPQGYQGVAWVDDTGSGVVRQFSPWVDDSGNVLMPAGSEIRSDISDTDSFKISVYDVDGASYTDVLTVTAGDTPTADLWSETTIGGGAILTAGADIDLGSNDFITGGEFIVDVDGTDVAAAGAFTLGAGADASIYWDGTYLQLDTTSATSGVEISGPAGQPGLLRLTTEETTVVDGDVLGRIDFLAPDEASGTDAIAIAASIWAEADATFDAAVNSTDLVFATGTSEAATEKMRLTHDGALVPSTTDALSLGTSALNWSDLFLDSGAVVNFDSGDITLTHSSNTLTLAGGNINMADLELQQAVFKDYGEEVNIIGSIGGGTQDIDLTLGNVVTGTVDTSETTFTFSNPSASGHACSFTFEITNGGSQTVNWPASVDWAGGTEPTLTSSGVDVLTFYTTDGGTNWRGFTAGLDMQ